MIPRLTWGEQDDRHGDEGADHQDDQQGDCDAFPVPLRWTHPAQVLQRDHRSGEIPVKHLYSLYCLASNVSHAIQRRWATPSSRAGRELPQKPYFLLLITSNFEFRTFFTELNLFLLCRSAWWSEANRSQHRAPSRVEMFLLALKAKKGLLKNFALINMGI